MSSAFVRESEEQWLHEVQPSPEALAAYLTRENNGVRVYLKRNYFNAETGKEYYEMSNGLGYAKDEDSKWFVI